MLEIAEERKGVCFIVSPISFPHLIVSPMQWADALCQGQDKHIKIPRWPSGGLLDGEIKQKQGKRHGETNYQQL